MIDWKKLLENSGAAVAVAELARDAVADAIAKSNETAAAAGEAAAAQLRLRQLEDRLLDAHKAADILKQLVADCTEEFRVLQAVGKATFIGSNLDTRIQKALAEVAKLKAEV